ncbi:MAG: hypothetical protein NTX50_09715 [Candidatus Sumerlaeota bacterium]|nr:hypothetical protein [Candidatus Sumerlaeota bacterium]
MLSAIRFFLPLKSKGSYILQAVLFVAVIAAFAYFSVSELNERKKWAKICHEEEQRLKQTEQEIQALDEQQRLLQSSPIASEKQIRRLMWARPDEQIIFINPPSK